MNEPYAVETRGLTRFFERQLAVDHVDIQVAPGSSYGFLGPNGAGKSTTIKMLTGLLSPSEGQIRILGMDPVTHGLDIKRRIGVVPEDLALFDHLTAKEQLIFVGRMFSMDKKTIADRSEELLSMMQLDQEHKKLTMEYSHGMKKKLAMAAALLPDPDLLFLDEPFEGVDAVTSRVIREMLTTFCSRGSTVFITSHVLEIVERLCTHVGIIAQGKLVEQASLEEMRRGSSLEECFLQKVGSSDEPMRKLSWLEDNGASPDEGEWLADNGEDPEVSKGTSP